MIACDTRAALINDIRGHLLENGPKRWKEIQRRYPGISPATFWRCVKAAKAAPRQSADGSGEFGRATTHAASAKSPGRACIINIQGGVSTSMIKDQYMHLVEGADLLRAAAIDQSGKILKPETLIRSLKLRDEYVVQNTAIMGWVHQLAGAEEAWTALFDLALSFVEPHRAQEAQEALIALSAQLAEKTCRPPTDSELRAFLKGECHNLDPNSGTQTPKR